MAYIPPLNGGRINASISGGSLVSTGTLVFAGGSNVSLYQNTNSLGATVSINANAIGLNTAKTNATWTVNSSGLSFNGAGYAGTGFSGTNASATLNSNGLQLSVGAGGGAAFSAGISSNSTVSNQLILNGGNNISLAQATNATGATVTINATGLAGTGFSGTNASATLNSNGLQLSVGAGGGGGGVALYDGIHSISSGTASISAAGAITAAITNQTLSLAVPAVTSLTAAGAISLSSAGSTITISAPPSVTVSNWEYPTQVFAPLNTATTAGSLSIQREDIPFYVSATAARIGGSLSVANSTAATTGSYSLALWMGIYTMNGDVLSLATSGSAINSITFQGASTASASYSSITGMRPMTVPMNINMTPGQYWVGAVMSASFSVLNATFGLWGNSAQYTVSSPYLSPFGSGSTNGFMLFPGQGIYKSTTLGMPASIPMSSINGFSSSYLQRAGFYHAFYNTVYT